MQYFLSGDPAAARRLVKVELLFDSPPYFAEPRSFDGVMVDDLLSLAVNKVTTLGRSEPKDYVDLYLAVRRGGLALENLIPLAREKVVGLDEAVIAASFNAVDNLPALETFQESYMVAPVDLAEVRRFYREWASRLLDVIPPRPESPA